MVWTVEDFSKKTRSGGVREIGQQDTLKQPTSTTWLRTKRFRLCKKNVCSYSTSHLLRRLLPDSICDIWIFQIQWRWRSHRPLLRKFREVVAFEVVPVVSLVESNCK
jgi:hypothetical protein